MSSPAFAKTMEMIKKRTLGVPDIVLGIRTMIGTNPHHTDMLALIDDLVVEAKRLYLTPDDVEGAERAAVVLDGVIALCHVRVT